MHQGEQLGLFLRINNIKKGDFAKKTGMSRGTLYSILKDKSIKSEYMDAIRKGGYNFDSFINANVQTSVHTEQRQQPKTLSGLEEEIKQLYEIIAIKDKVIDAQGQALKMAEQLLLKNQKSLARVAEPKKN